MSFSLSLTHGSPCAQGHQVLEVVTTGAVRQRSCQHVGVVGQDGPVMSALAQQSFDNIPERDTPAPGAGALAVPTRLLEAFIAVDVDEQFLAAEYPEILKVLLADRTTGQNIIWATDHYADFGPGHQASDEVTPHAITGVRARVIQPRIHKAQALG